VERWVVAIARRFLDQSEPQPKLRRFLVYQLQKDLKVTPEEAEELIESLIGEQYLRIGRIAYFNAEAGAQVEEMVLLPGGRISSDVQEAKV